MMYALVVNNTATTVRDALPDSARRQDTNEWVLGLPNASVAMQRACGWFTVTEVAQPADTPTNTTDRSIQLVGGAWTVVWTSRAKTAGEIAFATNSTNAVTIRTQAQSALAANVTFLGTANPTAANNTYIALASPTAAQTNAQVKALSQQMNAIIAQVRALTQQGNYEIRMALGQFDATT